MTTISYQKDIESGRQGLNRITHVYLPLSPLKVEIATYEGMTDIQGSKEVPGGIIITYKKDGQIKRAWVWGAVVVSEEK